MPGRARNVGLRSWVAQDLDRIARLIPILVIDENPGRKVSFLQVRSQVVFNETRFIQGRETHSRVCFYWTERFVLRSDSINRNTRFLICLNKFHKILCKGNGGRRGQISSTLLGGS